ncbi:hypothetical protein SUGI_0542090 [Cryptomeria japonica]|nr:hypothetical protein SUGI_0542090 [Cryptomeria japonica]
MQRTSLFHQHNGISKKITIQTRRFVATVSTQPEKDYNNNNYHYQYADVFSLLQACKNLNQLQQLHAHLFISGFAQNAEIASKLLNIYAECGNLESARLLFDKSSRAFHQERSLGKFNKHDDNISFWNAMIREYANALQEGKRVHNYIIKAGFESEVHGCRLLDCYDIRVFTE